MTVYKYDSTMQAPTGERVVALGFFDGVHIGHRMLLERARKRARELNIPFSVFTFYSECGNIKNDTGRLYSTQEKLSIIEECRADEVIIADFEDLKNMPPEQFVESFLIEAIGCRAAVCGRDFRFGMGAVGNIDLLSRIMRERGREALIIDDVSLFSRKVSTSAVKEYLASGDLASANQMLGAPYFIEKTVEHGRGVGRVLGFPTLNCELDGKMGLLKRGVYKTLAVIDGAEYPSLTNVGTCPTFKERAEHAETYVLNFSGDLYGRTVRILFIDYLREEKRFSSENELKMQINVDINRVLKEKL